MSKSVEDILQDLNNKAYRPLYFFYGDEAYYIDMLSDYIAGNVLTEAEQSFNQTVVYGKESDASSVINLAKRFPMMASHQVIIVKEAQELKDFEKLIHYVEQPLDSTLLVLNYKHKNPDKRKKVFKMLTKEAVSFESKKLYDNQVPGWISGYASSRKYRIEPKAAALLAEFLGSDLSKIVNEVDKLIVAVGPQERTLTPEHVERNIGISKDFNIFELQNALGKGDVLKANRIVNYFSQNEKAHPLPMIMAALYSYFSKLLLIHYSKDKSEKGVASLLKVHPFFAKDYLNAARRYSAAKLVDVISLLRETDMQSKGWGGSAQGSGALMKELVFKIMHR